MITHRYKKIKKQFPSLFHLHLHRTAPLKRRPTPDDQGEIMRPELRLVLGGITVGVACAGKDGTTLDAGV